MSEIIKQQAPLILAEIKKAKNILLHCHPKPDPDSVGSALAMKFALEQLNKKVTLIQGDSEIPKAFVFPGVEAIVKKSYGEIDSTQFDLFIILDSGSTDMISFRANPVFPENMVTIVIDHHASNKGYGKINCIDSTYPATAQLLFDLFKEMGIKLNHDIALNLFMGIYTDTGGFKYRSATADTLEVAAELARHAPDFTETIFTMENSNTKETLLYQGLALSSIQEFCGGRLAISAISYDQLQKNNIKEEDYSGITISNILKSVVGFDVAVGLVERGPLNVGVGLRTRDSEKYDVSKLAVALGGGGHKSAAGAKLKMSLSEALEKVVKTAEELYNF